jgi:hypothetical protein
LLHFLPRPLSKERLQGSASLCNRMVTAVAAVVPLIFLLESDKVGHVYVNPNGLAGFVFCSKEYPVRVAFALIDRTLELVMARVSSEVWMSCSRQQDLSYLKELFKAYRNPVEADSLLRVQHELDETKVVLVSDLV